MSIAERKLNVQKSELNCVAGGEPFGQAPALANLTRQVKAKGLNVMSFSGVTLEKLQSESAPAGSQDLLTQLDILIDGAYIQSLAIKSPDSPVSSSNQRVHIFNPVLKDVITWASDQTEIHILKDGSRIVTGYLSQISLSD